MIERGISTRSFKEGNVSQRYDTVLKPRAEQEIQAAAAAKASKTAKMAAETAAEASCQASLTLKPIREGFGNGMEPARELYEGYTEATRLPKRSSDYFKK
jgi:hypothetical protein